MPDSSREDSQSESRSTVTMLTDCAVEAPERPDVLTSEPQAGAAAAAGAGVSGPPADGRPARGEGFNEMRG